MNLANARSYAMEKWFDSEFSDQITYNGTEIQGHISYGGGSANAFIADYATLVIRVADVPAPAYRDTVIINETPWQVHQDETQAIIIRGDGLTWELPLIKDEKPKAWAR